MQVFFSLKLRLGCRKLLEVLRVCPIPKTQGIASQQPEAVLIDPASGWDNGQQNRSSVIRRPRPGHRYSHLIRAGLA